VQVLQVQPVLLNADYTHASITGTNCIRVNLEQTIGFVDVTLAIGGCTVHQTLEFYNIQKRYRVYPNPTTGQVTLAILPDPESIFPGKSIIQPSPRHLKLYDINGNLITEMDLNSSGAAFPFSIPRNAPSGTYTVEILDDNLPTPFALLIEKQ
jgi:hypothetical protein